MFIRHKGVKAPFAPTVLVTIINAKLQVIEGKAYSFNWDSDSDFSGNSVYAYKLGCVCSSTDSIVVQ